MALKVKRQLLIGWKTGAMFFVQSLSEAIAITLLLSTVSCSTLPCSSYAAGSFLVRRKIIDWAKYTHWVRLGGRGSPCVACTLISLATRISPAPLFFVEIRDTRGLWILPCFLCKTTFFSRRYPVSIYLSKSRVKQQIAEVIKCCLLLLGHGTCRWANSLQYLPLHFF